MCDMYTLKKQENNLTLAVLSWAHVLLLCGSLYVLIAAVLGMSASEAARFLLSCLWLVIPAAGSWFLIRRTRTLIVYLLFSAAICAALWLCTASILTVAFSIFLFLARCAVRIKKGRIQRALKDMPAEAGAQLSVELWEIPTFLDEPSPIHFAVFGLGYLGILPTGQYYLLRWMFFLLLAEVFICFMYHYLNRMWDFIRNNRKIANLPAAAIQRVGRVLLLMAAILLTLAVVPSVLYGREPLIGWLQNIHALPAAPAEDFAEMMMGGQIDTPDFGALAEAPAEPPVWLMVLSDVLMYVCVAAVVIILLVIIYHGCRNAARFFSQDEEDEILFLGTESREAIHSARPAKRKRERRTSPDQKIRRFYKKTIRRALPQRPLGWETPRELEQKAGLSQTPQDQLLHDLYEKARYSETGCTQEDVQNLLS